LHGALYGHAIGLGVSQTVLRLALPDHLSRGGRASFMGVVMLAQKIFILCIGLVSLFNAPAYAVSSLGAYNVNPNTVTVAGLSSGADMAVQLQVANSASIHGAAIMAGASYYCNQYNLALWGEACTTGVGVSVSSLVSYTKMQANAGNIDPVSNIGGKPIYMFSGTLDTVVYQQTMNDLQQYWLSFTSASNITYNSTTPAEHAWISPDATDVCAYLGVPFVNNCGTDVEQTFLTKFYGTLSPRNAKPTGKYVQFNQNTFCPSSNCAAIGMDSSAWLYVPSSCVSGACKLVVALHGCEQNQETVSTAFVKNSGINEWADNNSILVLYPQTISSYLPYNPEGCWDWWGYTGSNYALKSAPQMMAIMGMVHKITSGYP
jgi:poly(3-hydroxybutyrate) depolymerase